MDRLTISGSGVPERCTAKDVAIVLTWILVGLIATACVALANSLC